MRRCLSVFLVTLFLLNFPVSYAQGLTTLNVKPMKHEFELNPGDEEARIITVHNPGGIPVEVTTEINDYQVNPRGVPVLTEPEAFSAGRWLEVVPTTLHLKPGETKEVLLSVKVPTAEAEPGGHYAAVVFRFKTSDPEKDANSISVGITGRIAVVSLITVPGETIKQGALQRISLPFLNTGYPVPMELVLVNDGNIHLKTNGHVNISNRWGSQPVASVPLPGVHVFPSSAKSLQVSLDSGRPIGLYTATVSFEEEAIALDAAPVTFIVFPWTLTLGVTLVAVAIYLLGLYRGRKAFPGDTRTGNLD